MDPSLRPPGGGSVVVREAPPSAGGGLRFLARGADGRTAWTADAQAAERHASLREASRAALSAPPLVGALRPAYAVPASVAAAPTDPSPRPILRLVASDGEAVPSAPIVPSPGPRPEWPPNAGALMWLVWGPWVEAWRLLLFGPDQGSRRA